MNKTSISASAAVAALLAIPHAVWACASCGCTLSSDWESQGFSTTPGLKIDLRYDFLNQNQLRSGRHAISPGAASQVVQPNGPQEVEKFTKNNYYTLGLDYSSSPDWGVNIQVPYSDRSHSTLGTASNGFTPNGGGEYDSHTRSIGDVKVLGRYQGWNAQRNLGIVFGLKLPTGSYKKNGTSTDTVTAGMLGTPVPIDRGLQPGSGTTDAIVGAYYFDAINRDWDAFAQVAYQAALNSKEQYKPGNGANLNFGVRYMGYSSVIAQLQLNVRYVEHDSGANADLFSTGGTLAYLSPGLTIPVSKQASVYGFVQLPIYQDVRGVQLTPRSTASIGVRFSL